MSGAIHDPTVRDLTNFTCTVWEDHIQCCCTYSAWLPALSCCARLPSGQSRDQARAPCNHACLINGLLPLQCQQPLQQYGSCPIAFASKSWRSYCADLSSSATGLQVSICKWLVIKAYSVQHASAQLAAEQQRFIDCAALQPAHTEAGI